MAAAQPDQAREVLDPEQFRDVIGYFATGVTVITTAHEGAALGTTASAVSSISLEPPMLLVCMNKESSTGQAIAKARPARSLHMSSPSDSPIERSAPVTIVVSSASLTPSMEATHEGLRHVITNYFGDVRREGHDPQGFLADIYPEPTGNDEYVMVPPHFHLVRQYQVVVRGSGTRIGKSQLSPFDFHYADPSTPYGPIVADEGGIAFFTLRPRGELDAHWMPGSRQEMTAKRGRNIIVRVSEATGEELIQREEDGLAGFRLVLDPNETREGPSPANSGGQYYLVAGGSLVDDGGQLEPLSMLWVGADDDPATVVAGAQGAEVLVLQFPIWNPETEPEPGDRYTSYENYRDDPIAV